MQHTKFQDHRSIASREEDFLKVFTINGHGGNVGQVTQHICIIFPHSTLSFHMSFGYK